MANMTDLKFEYTCNLPSLTIDITIPQLDIKFNFYVFFDKTPLFSKVDDIINRLKEGDKFDEKGVGFKLSAGTHDEYISINNNRLFMSGFSISLDIVRKNLIDMFDTIKKQIGNKKKSELVDYMNKIYNYPQESLPVIRKLDGGLVLIYNPKNESGYYDIDWLWSSGLSNMNRIIDYLESDDEKILNKGVLLKDSGNRIDINYGFDNDTMCPVRTELEKVNLIKELKALIV
jgi:hypothetical protein